MNKSRLYWQCRRGMLELDLLLQGFLATGIDTLSAKELDAFEFLLDCSDDQLLGYLMGRVIPTDGEMANVANKIRAATISST